MCGITGIINYSRPLTYPAETVQKMLEAIGHRGPDSSNYLILNNNHLGHARLSILDLKSGDQPVFNTDKTICVVFNGEIFNYLELKKQYLADYSFYTSTDTEVIVALYEKFGIDFIQYLNGQYAIALLDIRREKTFLIRDRAGICPLYVATKNDTVFFASEIKSLLTVPEIRAEMDYGGFSELIQLWTPLSPGTLFKDIHEVRPGCYLEIDSEGESNHSYWDYDFHPESCNLGLDQATEQLDHLLQDAVRIRLRADVPVGAYLSGGLDSTVILSYLSRLGADLSTFSLTFADEQLNEEKYQTEAVEFFSKRHFSVRATNQDIADSFVQCIKHTETPLFRTSPAPMGMLSGKVHDEGYKVVLTGEGADEAFGGYDIFKEAKIRAFWSRNPDSVWRPQLLKKLYPYLDFNRIQSIEYLKQAFDHKLMQTEDLLYAFYTRAKTTSAVIEFLDESVKHGIEQDIERRARSAFPVNPGQYDVFNTAQYIESKTLLPGFLLSVQGDRMLMANSVEGRYPFLDHRIIEFAQSLKNRFKLNGLNEKYIIKRLVENRIPRSISRRPKQPYRAPDVNALLCSRNNCLLDYLSEEEIRKNGIFDFKRVNLLRKKALSGKTQSVKDNMLFTIILSTQIWKDIFFNQCPELVDVQRQNKIPYT